MWPLDLRDEGNDNVVVSYDGVDDDDLHTGDILLIMFSLECDRFVVYQIFFSLYKQFIFFTNSIISDQASSLVTK